MTMTELYKAIKAIAEKYDLKPGDYLKVTINHAGSPSLEYSRKITRERVEEGVFSELENTKG